MYICCEICGSYLENATEEDVKYYEHRGKMCPVCCTIGSLYKSDKPPFEENIENEV